MKKILWFILPLFLIIQCDVINPELSNDSDDSNNNVNTVSEGDIWVTGYVASWNYNVGGHGNWGNTPRQELNWNAFTHAVFFVQTISASTCQPRVPEAWENISPDRLNAFVQDAEANDVPSIMSFGGAGNEAFMDCIESDPERVADGIADFVNTWGFDGADIDAEPVRDHPNYDVFINHLRDRLPDAILTAAVYGGTSSLFARLHEKFDQINIMTYDLSGAWEGWYSWHNSPIYSANGTPTNIPGTGREYPNVEMLVNRFQNAGVPLSKIGFGIDLYGYVWTGVSAPEQDASNATRRWRETSYDNLVEEFPGIAQNPNWDEGAQAAWYGTDNQFVSFDNKRTIDAKFDYAIEKGVGGMIVWEITGSSELADYIDSKIE
ncbi:glycoside hydrolase family 18 protein [Balneola sp. MJW-20]|uniref:glycoside hydrolase family 18 protein n=1 Tax=Gracilimonas aurantiaca TaxID=3234185 RepID=UPI00346526A5